jgi:putative ATP-dependent endonuclease of OLD family
MQLKTISIKNFKGLKDENFCPKTFSCLVGENNAGKSTVLQALVYALNCPKNIPASMYYDENESIVFKLKFEGVLEGDLNRLKLEHKTKMVPLVYGGDLTLTAKYTKEDGLDLLVSKLVPLDESLREDAITANFRGMRSAPQARTVIQEHYPQYLDDLPENATPAKAKEYLKRQITALEIEQFVYIDTTLPSGISGSISALIPEPIYIPAVKNFEDDLKTTQSTSFGRLMGLLMDDLSPDLQDINDTLLDLKKRLNRYVDDNGDMQDERLPKVVELESTIEGFLSENFPNVSVDLEIPPPEIKTILNTAKIYIDDGSRDLIDNKGDGVKRSLTFSLLRAYVDILSRRNAPGEEEQDAGVQQELEKPLIFLFEEPELYLHPKAQRILFSTLAAISDKFQTVITTHSPLFFEPGVTAQFVRVAKEVADPKPIGKLYPVDFEVDQENLNTFRMAKFDHSEAAFFSNHIVLYEGESDDFFFRHMAATINSAWSFVDKNIALVEVGGKGNFSKFRRFFESFGLKVSILTDLDVLIKDFHHLGASDESVAQKGRLLQSLNQRVDELGITPQLTGRRVKKQCKNPQWIDKYETAKHVIEQVVQAGSATVEQIETFNSLFEWEEDESKYIVLTTDDEVKQEMIALLDRLRGEGIYVLSRGAIEQYYPAEVLGNTSKPERALSVIEHVTTTAQAIALSSSLGDDRPTEFEEILSSIFGA